MAVEKIHHTEAGLVNPVSVNTTGTYTFQVGTSYLVTGGNYSVVLTNEAKQVGDPNGRDRGTIGAVKSKSDNGNSWSSMDYTYNDKSPAGGKIFYCLKQIDYNGSFQ